MSGNLTKKRALIELVFAGLLWGYGFLATKWALAEFTPFEVLTYRFLIAFVISESFLFFWNRKEFYSTFQDWKLGVVAGLSMASFQIPQTIGMKYTTATKSGFITTLYVLLVPILNHFFFKEKIGFKIYLWAILALFGTTLLLNVYSENMDLNKGDAWTLICTLMAAIQIILIGKIANKAKSSYRLNSFQCFWTLITLLPFFISQESHNPISQFSLPVFGVISMAIGSSIIAFTIQIRTQKVISSETASLLFLLESPFAFMFGFIFLNEKLSLVQVLGALIILLSSYLTLREEQILHSK